MSSEINPGSADDIEPALRAYLSQRLGQAVSFAEPPEEVTGGRNSFVYTFRPEHDDLPDTWTRPLILRVLPLAEQAEREAAIQNWRLGCWP